MYRIYEIEKLIEVNAFVAAFDVVRPKDFYFAGEMHNFWELVFVKSGNAIATGDEQIYNLSPNQLLFHKPMEFHRIQSAGDGPTHLNLLSFRACGKGMDSFNKRLFSLNKQEAAQFENLFASFCEFEGYCKAEKVKKRDYTFYASKAAAMLETFLIDLLDKESIPFEPITADEESYHKIVKVMKEHCSEKLSVDELAALCLMSRSNMKRVFAKYSDKGIAKYFLSLKLRMAMQLLDSGCSAAETANLVGFSEISYFHNVFKRELGITPIQYQKKNIVKALSVKI